MPTNTAGSVARNSNQQCVHYLRADITMLEVDVSGGVTRTIGVIPAGSVILQPCSGVAVHVAFDDTTVVDIGASTDSGTDNWATNMITTSLGFVPIDEAVSHKVLVDTTIIATFIPAGSSVTVGAASVIICYIPPNDFGNLIGLQS